MGLFFLLLALGQLATCGLGLPLPRLLRRQAPYNLSIPMREIGSGPSRPNDPHYCCNLGADTSGVLQVFCMYDWYGIGQDYDGGGSGEEHSHEFDHPYHPKAKWDIPQPVSLGCDFSRKHKRSELEPRHKNPPDRDGDSDEWGMPEGGRDYAGRSIDPARPNLMGWPAPIGAHYKRMTRSLIAVGHILRAMIRPTLAFLRFRPRPIGPHRVPESSTLSTASVNNSGLVPPSGVSHLHTIHRRGGEPSTDPKPPYHLAPIPPANITPYDLDPHHEEHHSSSEDSEDDTRPFPVPPDRPHRPHYPMNGAEMPEDAPIIQIGPGGPPPEVVRLDEKKVIFLWDTNADVPSRKHGLYDRVKRHEKLPPNPPGITGDPLLIDEEDIPGLNEFEEEQLELLRHNSDLSTMPAWGGEANYERNDRLVRRSTDWKTLAAEMAVAGLTGGLDVDDVEESAAAAARQAFMETAFGNRIKARDEAKTTPSVVAATTINAADQPAAASPPSEETTALVVVRDLPTVQPARTIAASASSTRSASATKSKEPKRPSFVHRFLTKWAENLNWEIAEEAYQHNWDRDRVAEHLPAAISRSSPSSCSPSSSSTTIITTIRTATITNTPTPTAIAMNITTTAISSSSSVSTIQPSAQATLRLAPRIAEHIFSYHQYNKYADEEASSTAIVTVTAAQALTMLSTSSLSSPPPPPLSTVIATVTTTAAATLTIDTNSTKTTLALNTSQENEISLTNTT